MPPGPEATLVDVPTHSASALKASSKPSSLATTSPPAAASVHGHREPRVDRRAAPVVEAEPAGPVASHGPHRDLLPRLEPDSGVEPGHGRGDLPLAAVVGVGSEPAAVGERTRR